MGYYTTNNISFETDPGCEEQEKQFCDELLALKDNDPEYRELIEGCGVYGYLYDIEDDISELAPKYPGLLIMLERIGEGNEQWEIRWKGDDYEEVEAILPPFDNKNLWTKAEKKHND